MDLLIPSSCKRGKKHSPNLFNSQCAKAVKAKNHHFKEWKHHQTPQSRASFVQADNLCSKTTNNGKTSFVNRISDKIESCQTGSHSFWSLAKLSNKTFAILLVHLCNVLSLMSWLCCVVFRITLIVMLRVSVLCSCRVLLCVVNTLSG